MNVKTRIKNILSFFSPPKMSLKMFLALSDYEYVLWEPNDVDYYLINTGIKKYWR